MRRTSGPGESRSRTRIFLGIVLALVVIVAYISFQSRPVAIPDDVMAALRSHVGQEKLDSSELSVLRRGHFYVVELTESTVDGRRIVYSYEVTPDLQVTNTGMTVGVNRKNPLLLLFGLLVAAAFFAFAIFFVTRKLFSRRCPSCGNVLDKEELTLFGGAIAKGGESLAPIILTQHNCSVCGYKQHAVAPLPGHRAGSINVATLVRPSQEATVDRVHHEFLDSRTMTYADWEDKLQQLREEYERG